MIEVIKSRITQNEKICDDVFYLKIELPFSYPQSNPGQFVNVYLNNESKLLPRPISIFDHKDHELHLIYATIGDGTKELSKYKTNTFIKFSTPLGNSFTLPDFKINAKKNENNLLLVGGGMGIAPLHYLARKTFMEFRESKNKPSVYSVLGFRDIPFLKDEFEKYCSEVQICTEVSHDDCWHGNVITPLEECDYNNIQNWFTCGPSPMQRALSDLARKNNVENVQVSLEERMGCGFGACVGCSIKIADSNTGTETHKKVCKDGPVFIGSEVVW